MVRAVCQGRERIHLRILICVLRFHSCSRVSTTSDWTVFLDGLHLTVLPPFVPAIVHVCALGIRAMRLDVISTFLRLYVGLLVECHHLGWHYDRVALVAGLTPTPTTQLTHLSTFSSLPKSSRISASSRGLTHVRFCALRRIEPMLHRLCGPPSIPLVLSLAAVSPG